LIIDPISQTLMREITSIGSKPNGLAWDTRRKHLLVADVEDFKARLIDTSSGYILSTTKLPGRPRWCMYDYNRDHFLINIRDPPCVFMLVSVKGIDGTGEEEESVLQSAGSIPVSSIGPHGLDIDRESDRAFVAYDSGEVVVLDLRKENATRETASMPIAGEPDVVWYNPNKRRLYCAIGNPGVIDVIDTDRTTLAEEIHTEEGAHTFAFDNVRQQLYAFLPHSCRVAVYKEI
jgi:DNA-binding beta-propeller fold protein YncE